MDSLKEFLIENIEDYAEELVEIPEVKKILERDIALFKKLLRKQVSNQPFR